jgi:hypothetical protein
MDNSWLETYADALNTLDADPRAAGGGELLSMSEDRQAVLLDLARQIAHGTDRRNAPLASFLVGAYVGRCVAAGAAADGALLEAVAVAHRLLGVNP